MINEKYDNNIAGYFKSVKFMRGSRTIYDNVSCEIPKGKITAILGPSGAGKTTFLHLLGGLISPTCGDIHVMGKNIQAISKQELMYTRKKMGVLFQSGALFTQMNVLDNVMFPLRQKLYCKTDGEIKSYYLDNNIIEVVAKMKLEAVGLRGAANLMPNELSGGMARRVALARAIALDPEIMLYDEPFTGQDPIALKVVLKLIKTLNNSLGLTSIIISHDIEEVLSIADFVIVIAEKKVIASGMPDEVKKINHGFMKTFLNGKFDAGTNQDFHYPAPLFAKELLDKEIS